MAGRLLAALTRSSRAIGGVGAVATGLGALGSIMLNRNAAEAILSDSEAARLRALEERKREGQLGLTDKQRQLAERRAFAPIRSLAGDISRSSRDAGISQEGGFGAAVSKGLAEQAALTDALSKGQLQVQELDESRRMQNEAELRALQGKADAEKLANKNRLWQTLGVIGDAGYKISQQVGPGLSAAKQREIAQQEEIARMYGEVPDDTIAFLTDY